MESRTRRLDKLVRDNVVHNIEESGGTVVYRKLDKVDQLAANFAKLDEEMAELRDGPEPTLEKLADVREVIDSIAVLMGHRKVELESAQYDKRRELGSFAAGIFVETVTLPEDHPWNEYYDSDPKRFPEVK